MQYKNRSYFEHIPQQGQPCNNLKIEIYYHEGGYAWATGDRHPRGYRLSITPITIEQREGYTVESFTGFSGCFQMLSETKRYSEKQLQREVANYEAGQYADIVKSMLEAVNIKNKTQYTLRK